jgi:hypothetical protein
MSQSEEPKYAGPVCAWCLAAPLNILVTPYMFGARKALVFYCADCHKVFTVQGIDADQPMVQRVPN